MTETQEKKKIKPHFVQEILSKSMSSSIWKDLPPEVLEIVLARLPTHILCRFRLVCKEWNHLISQPHFATLRTLSPHKASSIFVSPKLNYRATISSKWQVLDPTEKRSYKLSDSFIMNSYLANNRNKGLWKKCQHLKWKRYTLAADGELIYTMYLVQNGPTMRRMHVVCNPVSKSFHEIPEFPEIREFYQHDIVVMSVDNVTQSYKIVTMEYWPRSKPGSPNLFLYESTTSTWKKLCEVPKVQFVANSSIFMKGIFYTLFVDLSSISFGHKFYTILLYSCDLVTGAWSKSDVDFPPLSTALEEYPQLVVSLGQLYMVRFTRCRTKMMTLSIWKIVLETKEVVNVATIRNFFKLSKEMDQQSKASEMPVGVGCADSIIILCRDGHRIKFNLLEKNWQELPRDTLDNGVGSGICACLVGF